MPADVLTQIIITAGGLVVTFMGGVFSRRSRHASAEVTLSAEVREWARQFEERARRAEERADEAEREASRASARAANCQSRMQMLQRHVERLEVKLREAGINPPTNPIMGRRKGES
jgi:hypothetical protein